MCPSESAILLCFHSVRMGLLILRHVVITLFAFCTCQCNSCAHDFHLHLKFRCCVFWSFFFMQRNLSIKKRPIFFHSLNYYNIGMKKRQSFFVIFVTNCRPPRKALPHIPSSLPSFLTLWRMPPKCFLSYKCRQPK